MSQPTTINRILRLIHTLRHLRLRQVVYQIYYRITGKLTRVGQVARPQVQGEVEEQGSTSALPVTFRFLNQEVTFTSPAAIDWNYAANGKLWTYNLNYFEFLRGMEVTEGVELIRSWEASAAGHKDGWEPYPTSLRLVSWIRFFTERGAPVPPEIATSIRAQYQTLWGKIEYHLGGNHLLENAIALYYTAAYLQDEAGRAKAGKLLTTELPEQYLPDGAHFELSGMYHIILLDRLLTLRHGLQTFPAPATAPEKMLWLRTALERQLGWLQAFATPDGRYAHFNDSTVGIAPDVMATLNRAGKLGLTPTNAVLETCGYRRWSTPHFDCWIDVAAIGPDYIPGHAHADNLTFELHVDGAPCIVDPAVSTYEKNARRAWERSTAAHNTVTFDGQNSSDVWGGFRMGKRTRTVILEEQPDLLTAGHDGYGFSVRRTWQLTDKALIVTDSLPGARAGVARLYFDRRCRLILNADHLLVNDQIRVNWSPGTAALTDYEQAAGWNLLYPAKCLEITFSERLETVITYLS